jgi:hypothetical protein
MTPIISARGGLSSQAYGQFALSLANGSYESIATVSVGSGGTSYIEFDSIGSSYKHLQIRYIAKDNRSGTYADDLMFRFNSDSNTSNYNSHRLYGSGGGTPSADRVTGFGGVLGAFIAANNGNIGGGVLDILDYTSTSKNKTTRALGGMENNSSGQMGLVSGLWLNNTDAITNIKIYPLNGSLFYQHSHFALYGIKG